MRLPEGSAATTSPKQTGRPERPESAGLFKSSDRIFYSVNPRSDQMQTPLGVTKLDPDIMQNFTRQAANPAPLEIFPAFLQSGDDATAFATLCSSLRRMYLHTEQATTFPAPLHLCELADESTSSQSRVAVFRRHRRVGRESGRSPRSHPSRGGLVGLDQWRGLGAAGSARSVPLR